MSEPRMTVTELRLLGGIRKPFADPRMPGRLDVNGVEWFATDPYPTWYRRDGKHGRRAAWAPRG